MRPFGNGFGLTTPQVGPVAALKVWACHGTGCVRVGNWNLPEIN